VCPNIIILDDVLYINFKRQPLNIYNILVCRYGSDLSFIVSLRAHVTRNMVMQIFQEVLINFAESLKSYGVQPSGLND